MPLSPDRRFRLVNDYATSRGYFSGFPNFHEADYGRGPVGGVFLLPSNIAEWRDVPRSTYGVYHIEDVPALFRAAATYAVAQGYPGAYPNCHQQDYGSGVVYGTILLKPGKAEWRDVSRAALGSPAIDDVGAMMRAASDYAAANGFAAAFPTFHQANHGAGVVYGLVLIPPGNAEWQDVLIADLFFQEPRDERTCVVLARFRNADGTLATVPAQPDFYQQYFFGVGNGALRDYFADVTHGRVNLTGSVFGWLDIGHTLAEHNLISGQAQRFQAFNWAMQAARNQGFAVDSFPRQVVVVNTDTDWGGVNRGRSMLLPHSATSPWSHSRAMHEFGHVLGLDDAFRTTMLTDGTTRDDRYLDQHCIMSYATRGARFQMQLLGETMEAGPGLNGVYVNRLGGIPPSRLVSVPPLGAAVTMTLAPLTHAEEDGALLVEIPPTLARPKTYWVELHDPSNWDRAIGASRVAVHETRVGDMGAYALEQNATQSLSSPADEAFITPDGSFGIRFVEKIGRTVAVRLWELGPTRARELRIVSIVYDPPGDDVAGERVVLRSDRRQPVQLQGWVLRDDRNHPPGAETRFWFPAFTLLPGEDVTVWTKAGTNDGHNLYWGRAAAVWNNRGGDTAVLLDNQGREVARAGY
jgi:lamin tail-like protein